MILTVRAGCALAGVEPLAYLRDATERIVGGWPNDRLDELLPGAWRAANAAKGATEGP